MTIAVEIRLRLHPCATKRTVTVHEVKSNQGCGCIASVAVEVRLELRPHHLPATQRRTRSRIKLGAASPHLQEQASQSTLK